MPLKHTSLKQVQGMNTSMDSANQNQEKSIREKKALHVRTPEMNEKKWRSTEAPT